MMKKILSFVLCMLLACAPVFAEQLAGGWSCENATECTLPEDVAAAFEEALNGYVGMGFTPVAYLGSQVVAGVNYAILCKGTAVVPDAVPAPKIVTVCKPLDGAATILSVEDFLIKPEEDVEHPAAAEITGGWTVTSEEAPELPEEYTAILDKAFEGFVGSNVEALALLGTQLVAGMNYAFVCRVTPVVPNAESHLSIVTVYADLEGNATITDFIDF